MTFEEYLRKQTVQYHDVTYLKIDHALRVEIKDGVVQFYIHPMNADGDTVDFQVHGNELTPVRMPNV